MLARLARELPEGPFLFEPKWDGFRGIAYRTGDAVELFSRHGRPLARYFPELVAALRATQDATFIVDGEIIVARDGTADFAALMARLHPAESRVARLSQETPAAFMAFDLLADSHGPLMDASFVDRRRRLESWWPAASPPLYLTPITGDRALAQAWLAEPPGPGIDGVIAKSPAAPYQPGKRTMIKVKREHTADCVVAGFRLYGTEPLIGSLLLGLYDGDELRHVGVVTSFRRPARRALFEELIAARIPLAAHPWRDGFAVEGGPMGRLRGAAGRWIPSMGLDWVPLPPERVVEVAYDQVDGVRFRHPARFRRWRPDRDPRSCTVAQLVEHA